MTSRSSMQAMTLAEPPQRPQTAISILNTRLSPWAQDIATCRSAGDRTSVLAIRFTPLPRLAGVTSPRQRCAVDDAANWLSFYRPVRYEKRWIEWQLRWPFGQLL